MINPYAIGFVCVAATAVAGVDYVVQAGANGQPPGAYALSDYIASYSARYLGAIAVIDKTRRQTRPARAHLPEAAAGWQRRDWVRDDSGDEAAMKGLGLLEARTFKAGVKTARKAAREEVWEYVRGDERVRLSARFEPQPKDGVRQARTEAFVAPGMNVGTARLEGYDIIQGVPFFRLIERETGRGGAPDGPLMLQAFLGDGVAIGVYAERPLADLPALLDAIDYDGLNAMLDAPAGFVGRHAPPVPQAQKAALLSAAAAIFMADPATRAAAGAAPAATVAPGGGLNGGQALGDERTATTVSRLSVESNGDASGTAPKRLTLSGGRACLGKSGGRLCD